MPFSDIQQGTHALLMGCPSLDLDLNGGNANSANGGQGFTFAYLVLTDVAQARTAKSIETQNAAGNTVNITTYDAGDEVTLTCKPAGPNRAGAKATNDYFPRPGGYAALIDVADIANITYLDNGTLTNKRGGVSAAGPLGVPYGIKSASKAATATGNVVWTLVLQRMDSIPSWVPLT